MRMPISAQQVRYKMLSCKELMISVGTMHRRDQDQEQKQRLWNDRKNSLDVDDGEDVMILLMGTTMTMTMMSTTRFAIVV